jgi:V8-like Glu-specific endopeptidase
VNRAQLKVFAVKFAMASLLSNMACGNVAEAACAQLDWSCFNSTVAIVGHAKDVNGDDTVAVFCSGVAVSPGQVLTAGHCTVSLSKPSITSIDVYLDALVPFAAGLPAAHGKVGALTLNRAYDRSSSLYIHDRGLLELDRNLPKTLNYPAIARFNGALAKSLVAQGLIPGATLHRIGFGQRKSALGLWENRRTWLRPRVESVSTDAIVTEDNFAVPGDSGGSLFLYTLEMGLILVGLHSTWDPANKQVYSPRIL